MTPSRVPARPAGSQHPRVRELLAVRKDGAAGRIMVEGAWEHDQLLSSTAEVEAFFHCPEVAEPSDRVDQVAARAAEVYTISPKLLSRLSRRTRPDGLVSLVRLPRWDPAGLRLGPSSLVLVADGVEYAGNLGTLIRTVDAARANCLVLTSRRARHSHPAVYSASRGTVLTTPVIEFSEISDAAGWLRGQGVQVLLADPAAPVGYRDGDYRSRPTAFVVGSEGSGLAPAWYQQGFLEVGIPMLGEADSLNVALAAGLLLFEARAQKEGW